MKQPPLNCAIALKDDPRERLTFESFPDTISESYTPSWRSVGGRATATTTAFWQDGSYGSFSLDLEFVAGLFKVNRMVESGVGDAAELDLELQNMEAKARWLQALCFPRPPKPRTDIERARGILKGEPPRVLVSYGRFLVIEGVLTSYAVVWSAPFHPVTVRPYHCKVSVGLKRLDSFYPDYYDIMQVASRRIPPVVPLIELGKDVKKLHDWVGTLMQKQAKSPV